MSNMILNPEIVRDIVLADCGLTVDDLISKNKTGRITFARSAIAWVLREYTDTTMVTITRAITGAKRGTTAAQHAIKRMNDGRCDEMASQVTGVPATGIEYARYVWIRADEKSQARRLGVAAHVEHFGKEGIYG